MQCIHNILCVTQYVVKVMWSLQEKKLESQILSSRLNLPITTYITDLIAGENNQSKAKLGKNVKYLSLNISEMRHAMEFKIEM